VSAQGCLPLPSEEWLDDAVVIHAMASLVVTNSVQLFGLGVIASNQFAQLFESIHRPCALQSVTLCISAYGSASRTFQVTCASIW
jgi:hypothetical protein